MDIVFQEGSTKFVRGWDASRELTAGLSQSDVTVLGGTSIGSEQDLQVLIQTGTTVNSGFILQGDAGLTIENLTPSVCSVANGRVDRVSNGPFKLRITHPTKGSALVEGFMTQQVGASVTTTTGFAAGSLAAHIDSQVRALVSGKTPSDTTKKWYSTWVPASDSFVRNPGHILAGMDVTGLSVASQAQVETGTHRGFALMISPRHFATAKHYPPNAGQYLKFMDASGVVHTRTVQTLNSGLVTQNQGSQYHDMAVGMLDSPLPAGCKVYKVLPETVAAKLPGDYFFNIPSVGIQTFGANMKTIIYGLIVYVHSPIIGFQTRTHYLLSEAGVMGIASDLSPWTLPHHTTSSAPSFVPINGELVYLGSQWTLSGSPFISGMIPEIEAWMASTDPTYPTLTKADLSLFTTYP